MTITEIKNFIDDYNFKLDKNFSTKMTQRFYKSIGNDIKIYIVLRQLHNTLYFLLTYKNENIDISSNREFTRVNEIYLKSRIDSINKFIFSYKKIFDYIN